MVNISVIIIVTALTTIMTTIDITITCSVHMESLPLQKAFPLNLNSTSISIAVAIVVLIAITTVMTILTAIILVMVLVAGRGRTRRTRPRTRPSASTTSFRTAPFWDPGSSPPRPPTTKFHLNRSLTNRQHKVREGPVRGSLQGRAVPKSGDLPALPASTPHSAGSFLGALGWGYRLV